jgi:hypothetical protein
MGQRIVHRAKIKFPRPKSELDFRLKLPTGTISRKHNMFGWQGKSATTNGVFGRKKL